MYARDFRVLARTMLSGNWPTAVAVCLVANILGGGVRLVLNPASGEGATMMDFTANGAWPMMVTITVAGILLSVLIGGAVAMGQAAYFMNLARQREGKFSQLFSCFFMWGKGMWMNLVLGFFAGLWSLVGFAPMAAALAYYTVTASDIALIIACTCSVLGLALAIWASLRYSAVPYLLADDPQLSVMEALRTSKSVLKGYVWRFFCLKMSFLGWDLLAGLSFGIGYLFLTPYIKAADTAFILDRMQPKAEQLVSLHEE